MNVQPFGRYLDARKEKPQLPANPDYNAPPLTVECLAKLDSQEGFNILVASEPKSSGTHWELYTYAGSGTLSAYLPGYEPAEVRSGAVVTDGKWHYCAMTFDGRTVRLYFDGEQVTVQRVRRLAGRAPEPGPFCVGHLAEQPIGCDGCIDEVRLSSVLRPIRGVPSRPFEDDEDTLVLMHFDPVFCGLGHSDLPDAFVAGARAALAARKALGSATASAVLVFDSLEGGESLRKRLLEGIGWFFDPALVFGCSSFGPIVAGAAKPSVGVLAWSDAVTVASTCADLDGGHRACGERLRKAMEAAPGPDAGHAALTLLFGDCHVPANRDLLEGWLGAGPAKGFCVGGSCPQNGWVYCRGEARQGVVAALRLSGPFAVRADLRSADPSPEAVLASAREAATRTAPRQDERALLRLAFDCVSRRQALGDRAGDAPEALQVGSPGVPLFGFYGSGEMGHAEGQASPQAVGGHLSLATLLEAAR